MKIFSRFPVFRFALPFSAGAICTIEYDNSPWIFLALAISGFLFSRLFTRRNYASGKYAQRWLAGIPFYCCFIGLGGCLTWLYQGHHYSHHFKDIASTGFYVMEIADEPVKTRSGSRFAGEVIAVAGDHKWTPACGKILVYVSDTLRNFQGKCGQTIIVTGKVKDIHAPDNPFAFDASRHFAGKGMWHQMYIQPGKFEILNFQVSKTPFYFARALRDNLLQKLKKYLGENELGVAGALLLGYEEWLDPELENYWAGAGVLHVLCVSGMHVMLIYVIFVGITVWMENKKMLRHLRYFLLMMLIWFYAMVTGFSPSVIRAAAMITFIIAGKWINRESSIYNLLCSSCMLLFLMNPYLIMSAGFQLSFLAVCGIIFIHQRLFSLWVAPNKFLHKTWEIVSVSIAAQVSTFPLSLYLFHQFPSYFLIANLMVIPLSTLVMYSGLLLLVTDWIPFAGMVTGYLTSIGIKMLNWMVIEIGKLPGALTQNIFIDLFETCTMYLIIICILFWLTQKSFTWFLTVMLLVSLFLTNRIVMLWKVSTKSELTVFHTKIHPLVTVVTGTKAFLISDTIQDSKNIRFTAGEYLVRNMIQNTNHPLIGKGECLELKVKNCRSVFYLNSYEKEAKYTSNFNPAQNAIWIFSGNISASAGKLLSQFHPSKVIFDNTCGGYELNKLKSDLQKSGVQIHSVKQEGACLLDLTGNF